jgi:hypothetical protein
MNQLTRYSAVPVGETIIDPKTELNYIKSSVGRAKLVTSKTREFKRFEKHAEVIWVNAWPTNIAV